VRWQDASLLSTRIGVFETEVSSTKNSFGANGRLDSKEGACGRAGGGTSLVSEGTKAMFEGEIAFWMALTGGMGADEDFASSIASSLRRGLLRLAEWLCSGPLKN
jgi:hypothetical protein